MFGSSNPFRPSLDIGGKLLMLLFAVAAVGVAVGVAVGAAWTTGFIIDGFSAALKANDAAATRELLIIVLLSLIFMKNTGLSRDGERALKDIRSDVASLNRKLDRIERGEKRE